MIEYSGDRNYITQEGGNGQQNNNNHTNQFMNGQNNNTSAFSASSSRLNGLDQQYQQQPRRQMNNNGIGFDSSGQNVGYIGMSDPYGSIQLGNYETPNIMDWNGGVRSLGVMDSQFGITQSNSGIFQQTNSGGGPDWSAGLGGNSLGIPLTGANGQSYNLSDLTQFHSQQIALGAAQQLNSGLQRGGRDPRYPNGIGGGGGVSPRSFGAMQPGTPGTGGSNAQGRALNKMLLDILRERMVDPNRLAMAIDANIERMDCVNLATLLFHTGKKRLLLTPSFIKRIAMRFSGLKEELRAREASNALYGLKCMSSECPEVRQLVFALASKLAVSQTELVAQAVGNALYGCQMMTSDHEEVRYLLHMVSIKVAQCTELLEAQNVGNALYGLRGMNSDCKEVRMIVAALTPKIATAREELNGQALGNSLYGLQGMNSREPEIRSLLSVLASKVSRTWEDLKAQEVGNALYGLKRMNSDVTEVRQLIEALVPKVATSPEILDAQAIGNSFYGMQNMRSDNAPVLLLLGTMADKVMLSPAELDGQAMGNSLYGLQGMRSDKPEVRAVVNAITIKIQASCLEMNAQELGNALYGLQNMTCEHVEVRRLLVALTQKVATSKHELTSQEIGNAIFGIQGMRSEYREVRQLIRQLAFKIQLSSSLIDPQGIANSLFGLQRMTSNSEEVRLLLAALTVKIEQSWKVLSPQHISNSMFGLQNLCSAETEVRGLIHALIPKILASRDELTPKQICISLYGLRNCFSHHDEVRALMASLTEKLSLCTGQISLQVLSLAFFGAQGMDSNFEEVRALVMVLCEKLANVDEIDAFSVANILFGLQRMNSAYLEVQNGIELLSPMVMTLADAGLEIGVQVCASLIYGIQNCSCADEGIRRILFVALAFAKDLITSLGLPQTDPSQPSNLPDALCLHQALSLSLQVLPGLQMDTDLHAEMRQQQDLIYRVVESRKNELPTFRLSVAEKRLADSIADVLMGEPFVVTTGELLHGFEASIVIRLRPGLNLMTKDGVEWSPVLNIEVATPRDSSPKMELFNRLRTQYLFQEMGVVVQTIPSTSLAGQTRAGLRELLRQSNDLFSAIYPPTVEDAANFNAILVASGLVKGDGLLSSLSAEMRFPPEQHIGADSGTSFFSLGGGDSMGAGGLDEFDPVDENSDYFDPRLQPRTRAPFGMLLGWIGELPVVSITPNVTPRSSPTMNYSSTSNRRSPASKYSKPPSATALQPVGQVSRASHQPFVQIGPPMAGTALGATGLLAAQGLAKPSTGLRQQKASQVAYSGRSASNVTIVGLPDGEGDLSILRSEDDEIGLGLAEDIAEDGEHTEMDSEIALLEAQLEIKRLEAKLLQLKKSKSGKVINNTLGDGNDGNDVSS